MPIRIRLALWYSGIFTLALVAFGTALYVLMDRHLEQMVTGTVANRTSRLVSAVRAANEQVTPEEPIVIPPLDSFETSTVYLQILDPEGAILDRSSNLGDRLLPVPRELTETPGFSASLNGEEMNLSLTPVTVEGDRRLWVQVGATYQQRDLVLNRLLWALAGGGLATVASVGLVSALIAGRALHPVSEMTEIASAIALSKGFSRRLSAKRSTDELGRLAQTFNEMLTSLEEAYAAQQRFTADASHELRAPLTSIWGNLELLDRFKDMPQADRQHTVQQARREVERLSRLVRDLLALARADAGQGLEMRPVEVDALLVEVHRQGLALSDGVSLGLGSLEPCLIQGDEDRLKEVLLALVDNALRYTPAGGQVTLSLEREPPWVSIAVEDTGIGIQPEDLSHIFERFWRADKARSRDANGTGLGLSIAKWVVDRHGGEILVDSQPGTGSRFTLHLPSGDSK